MNFFFTAGNLKICIFLNKYVYKEARIAIKKVKLTVVTKMKRDKVQEQHRWKNASSINI